MNVRLFLFCFHSSETLPDEKEFVVVTEEEQEDTKGFPQTNNYCPILGNGLCFVEERVDLSVRKRKAPSRDEDELVVQNAAKRIKDDAIATAVVQEI